MKKLGSFKKGSRHLLLLLSTSPNFFPYFEHGAFRAEIKDLKQGIGQSSNQASINFIPELRDKLNDVSRRPRVSNPKFQSKTLARKNKSGMLILGLLNLPLRVRTIDCIDQNFPRTRRFCEKSSCSVFVGIASPTRHNSEAPAPCITGFQ
ncbi:hypothetical protein HN011_007274 [Eciton burchellii]|nr:hypothetical protein HN011_007274 [Eciton burchellii]